MLILNAKYKDSPLVAKELAANETVLFEEDDNGVARRMREEAGKYDPAAHDGKRLECWLVFAEMASLWLLLQEGVDDTLSQKTDIAATTMDDLLAKQLLTAAHSPLDRQPIGYTNNDTVHLVIFGTSPLTEALAVNTALVAHYPNYCRDVNRRTRITIIDENVIAFRDKMTMRYGRLFDNSYYRTLDLEDTEPQCVLHHPMYEDRRKDFVDVEWEFVRGGAGSDAVRRKLAEWSTSSRWQLTVALCNSDEERNVSEAVALPDEVYAAGVPVLCHTEQTDLLSIVGNGKQKITPMSYSECQLDCLRTLKAMGKRVNHVYNYCYALPAETAITAPPNIDYDLMEKQWSALSSFSKQYSNIASAMSLITKMRSVGLTPDHWEGYYALSKREIELLAEVEHNRWSVEELILGYRPVTDEEQADVERDINLKKNLRNHKIHYDLRSYDDLRTDATGKNVVIYDMALTQGIPLIIKTCITD